MALRGDDLNAYEIPLPTDGVNIGRGRLGIGDREALQLMNMTCRGVLRVRDGHSKRASKQVNEGSNRVNGLHRFYKQDGSKTLFVASGNGIFEEQTLSQRLVPASYGTVLGDATSQQANAFDSTTSQTAANSATKTSATSFYLGKDWGAGNTRTLTGYKVYSSSDQGIVNGANPNVTVKIQGSTDAGFSSPVDLHAFSPQVDSNGISFVTLSGLTQTAYRYHRVLITHDGGAADMYVAEVEFYHTTEWELVEDGQVDDIHRFTTWGEKNKVYVAQEGGAAKTIDSSNVVAAVSNITGNVVQFLQYQDRMLYIGDDIPGGLGWSASYQDDLWYDADTTQVKVDSKLYGMVLHSVNNRELGEKSSVLLAGAQGMYLFGGTNLTFTFGNYIVDKLALNAGCQAPRTMVWTPLGTIFLASDNQVYLLPFNSLTPIPIGVKITSLIPGFNGIEKMSSTTIQNAHAVYHDGYYKLAFQPSSESHPNTQFWLDVEEAFYQSTVFQDLGSKPVKWYGPMTGMNLRTMLSLSGAGDGGTMVAGESSTTTGAYVYDHGPSNSDDDGTDISFQWFSSFQKLSSQFFNSVCHHIEIELLNTVQSFIIEYFDSAGGLSLGQSMVTITAAESGSLYGTLKYGEQVYSNLQQVRKKIDIDPPLNQRYVALRMRGSTDLDLEINAIRIQEDAQNEVLDQRGL